MQFLKQTIYFLRRPFTDISNLFSPKLKISLLSTLTVVKLTSELAQLLFPMESNRDQCVDRIEYERQSLRKAKVTIVIQTAISLEYPATM